MNKFSKPTVMVGFDGVSLTIDYKAGAFRNRHQRRVALHDNRRGRLHYDIVISPEARQHAQRADIDGLVDFALRAGGEI